VRPVADVTGVSVTLQPLVWELRVHPSPGAKLPARYEARATVTIDDMGVASIRGAAGTVCHGCDDAVASVLFGNGITRVIWSRARNGELQRFSADIALIDGVARFQNIKVIAS